MNQEREAGTGRQSPGEEPVTLDRELPSMPPPPRIEETPGKKEQAEGPRMGRVADVGTAETGKPPSSEEQRGQQAAEEDKEGGRMPAHDEAAKQGADARAPHGDQKPPDDEREKPEEEEGYVRLRVVGAKGQWHVEGRTEVSGPLEVPDRLRYGWAWEVRYGGERLGLGLVPDMGEVRGFPDPEGRPGMEGHHIAEPSEPTFVARIPAEALRNVEVEELEIQLYRVQEPPAEDLGPEPLDEQFPDRVERVYGRPKSK